MSDNSDKSAFPRADEHPEVDYHETEDCFLPLYFLGRISVEWNFCEHLFGTLIWHHFEGIKKGLLVTSKMGNQSRADLLLSLVRRFETNQDVLDRIEFATRAFNRLRETRNILIHTHGIDPHETGKLEWRRASPNAQLGHTGSLADLDDLIEVLDNIAQLSQFIIEITCYYFDRQNNKEPQPLPDTFPLPKMLTQLPAETPPQDT